MELKQLTSNTQQKFVTGWKSLEAHTEKWPNMWRWNKQDAVWRKTLCSYSVRREGREAGWLGKHNFSFREPEGLAVKSEAEVCIIQEV